MINEKASDPQGNMHFQVTSEPSIEPVNLDDLKTWARIDGTDEDDLLSGLITSARKNVEKYLGMALISQTITMYMDEWNSEVIELPYSPVISITSIVTLGEDDAETTYNSSYYYLVPTIPARLVIKDDYDPPENTDRFTAGYKITYVAGYGTAADDVPQTIREAIKTWVTYMYENRDPSDKPPQVVRQMLKMYRLGNL